MKVLLLSANASTAPHPVYPLGLDHVAGALGDAHEVRTLDVNVSRPPLLLAIEEFDPDVVGLSVRNIDNCDLSDTEGFTGGYRRLAGAVRGATSAKIVLGGAGFTLFPGELMEALDADYGVVGEGERLGALLDALDKGNERPALPGVVLRGRPAKLPEPWPGPFPRAIPMDSPHLRHYVERGGILNLQTKRGCPFRCIYCTYPFIEGRDVRLIDPTEASRWAKRLQDAGAAFLFIADSVFNAHAEHSLAVARALREAGVTIPWGAFFSPTRPPADYYRRLAEAGLTHVEFGTDTLSDAMLGAYRKPFKVADVLEAHANALAAGLNVAHFLALGGPGESARTLDETLDNAEQLDRCAVFFFAGLRVFPGTALWETAVREGQIAPEANLLEPVFYRPASLELGDMLVRVSERAADHANWIVGGGGGKMARVVARFHDRGYTGPLWEKLIR